MNKRDKKRIQVLRDRLTNRRQQLTGAREQPDEPNELLKLCADIDAIQAELDQLEKASR